MTDTPVTATFRVSLQSRDISFETAADQTILHTALEQRIDMPHGCKGGRCGQCKSRLIDGTVVHNSHSRFALSQDEKDAGLILPCVSVPQSDLVISAIDGDDVLPDHPALEFEAEVTSITDLTHDIKRLRLANCDPAFKFSAGQYVQLGIPGLAARDYSMANVPDDTELEFHIRRVPGGEVSGHIHDRVKVGDRLVVRGPFGASHLRTDHIGPIVAIAGGSGLAPIKSIVESALTLGMRQPIHVYFGARQTQDLYLVEHFRSLEQRHANLHFTAVLSEETDRSSFRSGLVTDTLASDFESLEGWKAYAAGPPAMVESAMERLTLANMAQKDIHADVFFTPQA